MYRVKFTSSYKKSYRKMFKRGVDLSELDAVVAMLMQGAKLPQKYNDHALKGKFLKHRECHIRPDWLLVYLIEDDILTLTLVNTGSHADIFSG